MTVRWCRKIPLMESEPEAVAIVPRKPGAGAPPSPPAPSASSPTFSAAAARAPAPAPALPSVTCTRCARSVPHGKFCSDCGAPLPPPSPPASARRFCARCGTPRGGAGRFCESAVRSMSDDQGFTTRASRIELVEASGPVSPRHSYTTTIALSLDALDTPAANRPGAPARVLCDHRDASGAHHDEQELDRAAYVALLAELLVTLPLGAPLDLAGAKRDRKGISFNHVAITVEGASTRLDYVLSDLDEEDGDPRARAVVSLVKHAAGREKS
jgi:hypothetical protein